MFVREQTQRSTVREEKLADGLPQLWCWLDFASSACWEYSPSSVDEAK